MTTSLDRVEAMERVRAWASAAYGSDLERLDVGGRLLFRCEIVLGPKETVPVVVEPLSLFERNAARREARALARSEAWQLDPDKDPDLWVALDGYAVLARAIRDPEPPFGQHRSLENLILTYAKIPGALERVADLYRVAEQIADPRVPVLTDAMFWELVKAVRERGHLGPLGSIGGSEQAAFVISMADRLWISRTESSSTSSPSSSPTEP